MNKIIILLLISLNLSGCASKASKVKDKQYVEELSCPEMKDDKGEFKDTSGCTLKVSVPDQFTKKSELSKEWVRLGVAKGLEFNFGINQGHYWVSINEKEQRVHPEAEIILNIKSKGDSNIESLTLVRTSQTEFQGFGFKRFGSSNFILIYKTPGQKEVVFDFDLDIN